MNRSQRGAANIRKFNAERAQRNLPLLRSELMRCKRRKLNFDSIGKLAEYVGSMTGIHRTTLIRNPTYKALLVEYLASRGGTTVGIPDEAATAEVLRAKLLGVRLELSNVREKCRRLEAYISQQGSVPSLEVATSDANASDYYVEFVDTAMALAAVLERLSDTTALNTASKTIEDLAARPSERIIVGPERTSAFIAWLQQQETFSFKAKK